MCNTLKFVVLVDEDTGLIEKAESLGIKVRLMSDIETIGEQFPREATPSKNNDIATFV